MKTTSKIKLVVVGEHTLGYIQPAAPDIVCVLRANHIKGAAYTTQIVYSINIEHESVRLASKKDFDDYRVEFNGYEKDSSLYEYANQ